MEAPLPRIIMILPPERDANRRSAAPPIPHCPTVPHSLGYEVRAPA